jgi:predicted nucleic acid-binding protein
MSVIRGHVLGSKLALARAEDAVNALSGLNLALSDCQALLDRIWQLRHNMTSYDAAYVALAESLEVPLVTADQRLGNAGAASVTIFGL